MPMEAAPNSKLPMARTRPLARSIATGATVGEKRARGHFRDPLALSCSVGPAGGYGQGFPAQTESLLIARQQRNEDADRQIETGMRFDASIPAFGQKKIRGRPASDPRRS